jgi:hypothetical protein
MEFICEHCRLPIWHKSWVQYQESKSDYFHLHLYCHSVNAKYDPRSIYSTKVDQRSHKLKPPKDYQLHI